MSEGRGRAPGKGGIIVRIMAQITDEDEARPHGRGSERREVWAEGPVDDRLEALTDTNDVITRVVSEFEIHRRHGDR